MGYLIYRVPVIRTGLDDSFVIGNYPSLNIASCLTTRVCKFASDRGIVVLEVVLLNIKAIIHCLDFNEELILFRKLVIIKTARFSIEFSKL